MRMIWAAALLAAPAWAEEWRPVPGERIAPMLTARNPPGAIPEGFVLLFEDGAQTWDRDGATRRGPRAGRWDVRGDLYCATWPPSDVWACHEVATAGAAVRFTGEDGDVAIGYVGE